MSVLSPDQAQEVSSPRCQKYTAGITAQADPGKQSSLPDSSQAILLIILWKKALINSPLPKTLSGLY